MRNHPRQLPPNRPGRVGPRRICAAVIPLAALVVLVGCQPQVRVVKDGWASWAQGMGGNQQGWSVDRGGSNEDSVALSRGTEYTLPVERFVGSTRREQAAAFAERLRNEVGLARVQVLEGEAAATVTVGRVSDPGSAEAQKLLRQVRNAKLDGYHPFSEAKFTVADPSLRPVYDPLNLKQHRGMMTLQIGFYDDRFQGDRRRAAEKAAQILREDGHEAYYYHGPFRSMITVGLFTQADFVMENGVQAYGPRIEALQKEFPYNLGNGVTLVEKRDGKTIGEQESCIVRVF